MEHISSFVKGLSRDFSKMNIPKEAYTDALNIQLLSDEEQSSVVLSNVKGNQLFEQIEESTNILELHIPKATPIDYDTYYVHYTGPWSITLYITTDSPINSFIVINTITGDSGLSSEVNDAIVAGILNNPFAQQQGIKAWSSEVGKVYISSNDYNLSTLAAQFSGQDINTGLTTTNASTADGDFPFFTYVSASTNNTIIGSSYIRDDLYLFTTGLPSESNDCIWKISYNRDTLLPTTTLIYKGALGFSASYPIKAESRYETPTVQKLFWTDDYNVPRYLNVVDPDAYKLPVNSLSLFSTTALEPPHLLTIENGGTMLAGTYYIGYRLRRDSGPSGISPLSQSVVISPIDLTQYEYDAVGGSFFPSDGAIDNVTDYTGVANRSIRVFVDNLPPGYEQIEFWVYLRGGLGDRLFGSPWYDLNDRGQYEYLIDGIDDFSAPSNEFTISTEFGDLISYFQAFSKVKDLASKDNRLFLANVTEGLDLAEYDARATRYQYDSTTEPAYMDSDTQANPYNKLSTRDTTSHLEDYKYQKYSPTAAYQKIGGTGTNISYEFTIRKLTSLDTLATSFGSHVTNAGSGSFINGITINGKTTNFPISSFNNYKNPFLASLIMGYQRAEVYRFGIVFYSAVGKPSTVKWIDDIRMPDYFDYYNDPGEASYDFSISYINHENALIGKALGVTFTVDIPEDIRGQASGFSIVRAKRKPSNKTVISDGALNYPSTIGETSPQLITTITPSAAINSTNNIYIDAANYKFNNNTSNGDGVIDESEYSYKFIPNRLLDRSAQTGASPTGLTDANYFTKYYDSTSLDWAASKVLPLTALTIGTNGQTGIFGVDPGILKITNNIKATVNLGEALDTINTAGIPVNTNFASIGTNTSQIGGYIYRELDKQYPDDSEYISIGHYQKINNNQETYTCEVWGGDTIVTAFSDFKYILADSTVSYSGVSTSYAGVCIVRPHEVNINSEMKVLTKSMKRRSDIDIPSVDPTVDDFVSSYTISLRQDAEKFLSDLNFVANTDFDTTIYASEVKYNGEPRESWGVFKTNNFIDVDGQYGAINRIETLNDNFYFIQDSATGLLSVNPRVLIQDTEGTELELGTGDVLNDYSYLSTEVGTTNKWSVAKSRFKLYIFDTYSKKIFSFSKEGLDSLSEIKGLNTYFKDNLLVDDVLQDSPITGYGILSSYDPYTKNVYFTFRDSENAYTISYNESLQVFESFLSFKPSWYVVDKINLFSTPYNEGQPGRLFIHSKGDYGNFYGATYDSTIQVVANSNQIYTKVFDDIVVHTQATEDITGEDSDAFYYDLLCTTDYQTSPVTLLTNNSTVKRRERNWNIQVPRNQTYLDRLRDKYMTIKLNFDNSTNTKLITNYIMTKFRISPR